MKGVTPMAITAKSSDGRITFAGAVDTRGYALMKPKP
jgi:hypothetical protein